MAMLARDARGQHEGCVMSSLTRMRPSPALVAAVAPPVIATGGSASISGRDGVVKAQLEPNQRASGARTISRISRMTTAGPNRSLVGSATLSRVCLVGGVLAAAWAAGCGGGGGAPFLSPPTTLSAIRPGRAAIVVLKGCKVAPGLTGVPDDSGPVDVAGVVSAAGGKGKLDGWSDAYEVEFTGDGRLQYCLAINSNVAVRADGLLGAIAPHAEIRLVRDLGEGENGTPGSAGVYRVSRGGITAAAIAWIAGSMQGAVIVEAPADAVKLARLLAAKQNDVWSSVGE